MELNLKNLRVKCHKKKLYVNDTGLDPFCSPDDIYMDTSDQREKSWTGPLVTVPQKHAAGEG